MRGRRRIGIDSEGYLIGRANKTPPTVCVTFCCDDGSAEILKWKEARGLLFDILNTPSIEIVLHHARFDLASFAAMDSELLPKVFRAYDEDRVRCTMIREKLLALAKGELADEGDTGAKRNKKFSLAAIVLDRFHVDLSEGKSKATENPDGSFTVTGNKASWRLRYSELENVPLSEWPEDARKYALDDPRWNLAVYDAQDAELLHQGGESLDGVIPDEMYQTRAAFWLYLTAAWGIRTDPVAVNALSAKLEADWARINTVVRAGDVLKPQMKKGELVWTKNMAAIRSRVVMAFGGLEKLPLSAWTAGGKDGKGKKEVSTSGETLLACVHRPCLDWIEERERAVVETRSSAGLPPLSEEALTSLAKTLCHSAVDEFHPPEPGVEPEPRAAVAERIFNQIILDALSDRGAVEKLLKTYVPMLRDGTQRPICAGTNELVATGRTSFYDPNLQNPPRKGGVRECFIPRRGRLFAFCDYSFIELVTLAQVCLWKFGYSVLGESINAGKDPHLVMAAAMLGITYEEIYARRKEPLIKAARQGAKAINFGRPGGLGDEKFVEYAYATYGVRMTRTEAKRYKELWFETYPEMREYLAFFGKMSLGDREFTITQLPSGRVRGGCHYTSGANSMFQGLAADGIKRAGWNVSKECYLRDPYYDGAGPTALFGSRIVAMLHDELILEVPEEGAHEATERLSERMISGMREVVPDIKVGTEAALARRWYKGAEPTFVDGRLVPWEPKEQVVTAHELSPEALEWAAQYLGLAA